MYVHVFDQVTQDSDAVLSIIKHIFLQIKTNNNLIENAYIRSDNAACYHSAQTLLSLPGLGESTGIKIRRFDFSDPQGGKGCICIISSNYYYCVVTGSSDRYAAVLKSHVRRYLNEGHDISTAAQFVEACESYGGVKNVHVFECQLPPNTTKCNVKIQDITKLHNFIYEENCIRIYRAWNIGTGKLLTFDGDDNRCLKVQSLVCVNGLSQTSQLTNSGINARPDLLRLASSDASISNDPLIFTHKLFYCNSEGCIARFLQYGNLLRHIAAGNHREKLERVHLKDLSMITYKSKLDAAECQETLRLVLERTNFSQQDFSHIPILDKGWALPASRKVQKMTPRVRQFLKKKFDDGQLNGIRWQPEAVVNEMKYSKHPESGKYIFSLSELVKVSTVRSFFSRQKTKITTVNKTKDSTGEDAHVSLSDQHNSEEEEEDNNETFEEQRAINLEVQRADIRSNYMKAVSQEHDLTQLANLSVTATSKRTLTLTSLDNERSSVAKRSSKLPRKSDQ